MIGEKFGRLTVLNEFKKYNGKRNVSYLKCLCECGTVKEINTQHVKRGKVVSCGCYNKELVKKIKTTHGMYGTSFYNSWINILKRCDLVEGEDYEYYGGRGITLCDRWRTFEKYAEDMLESYQNHVERHGEQNTSLVRIDVNGNYDPVNSIWATVSAQNTDRRTKHQPYGMTGVYLLKNGTWMVKIRGEYIGVFDNKIQAIKARKHAEQKYNYRRG